MNNAVKRVKFEVAIKAMIMRLSILCGLPLLIYGLATVKICLVLGVLLIFTMSSFCLSFRRTTVFNLVYTAEATSEDILEGERYIERGTNVLYDGFRIFSALLGLSLTLYEIATSFSQGINSYVLATTGLFVFSVCSISHSIKVVRVSRLVSIFFLSSYAYIISLGLKGGLTELLDNVLTVVIAFTIIALCLYQTVGIETRKTGLLTTLTALIHFLCVISSIVGLTQSGFGSFIFFVVIFIFQVLLTYVIGVRRHSKMAYFS